MTTATHRIPAFTLGDRLRKARETAGMDQRAFAAVLGVNPRTVGNCERDQHRPRPIVIRAWSLATGVPVQWLETGTAPTDDPPAPFTCATRDSNPEPADSVFRQLAACAGRIAA